jgi:hypothetical protein
MDAHRRPQRYTQSSEFRNKFTGMSLSYLVVFIVDILWQECTV